MSAIIWMIWKNTWPQVIDQFHLSTTSILLSTSFSLKFEADGVTPA